MKNIIYLLIFVFLSSCDEPNPNKAFEKKIYQKIDASGMGMLKDLKIQDVEKVNDTTYKATHTFTNPILNREMRITKNYFFSLDGETINGNEEISIEMKSQGEWVKTGL